MGKVMPIIATGTVLTLFSLVAYTGFIVGKVRTDKSNRLSIERLTYQSIKYKLQRDECYLFVTEIIKQPQTKESPKWY